MLQDDNDGVLDLPGNKERLMSLKLTMIGNGSSQGPNYSYLCIAANMNALINGLQSFAKLLDINPNL